MHFLNIDSELAQIIMCQNFDRPSGHKQYLYKIRTSNVSPKDSSLTHPRNCLYVEHAVAYRIN